jgi:hypothetical protein
MDRKVEPTANALIGDDVQGTTSRQDDAVHSCVDVRIHDSFDE